jgi:hypothetical protein
VKKHKLLPFLIGFIIGDFIHAFIMDIQDSGDFFNIESLGILLIAGPATSPILCFTIMISCGFAGVFLQKHINSK